MSNELELLNATPARLRHLHSQASDLLEQAITGRLVLMDRSLSKTPVDLDAVIGLRPVVVEHFRDLKQGLEQRLAKMGIDIAEPEAEGM